MFRLVVFGRTDRPTKHGTRKLPSTSSGQAFRPGRKKNTQAITNQGIAAERAFTRDPIWGLITTHM
jgi:hypothetical protein